MDKLYIDQLGQVVELKDNGQAPCEMCVYRNRVHRKIGGCNTAEPVGSDCTDVPRGYWVLTLAEITPE